MNYNQFIELAQMVSPLVTKPVWRKSISSKERLALTLWFSAAWESFRSLEYQFRISRKAISYIVSEVCQAIYKSLASKYLKFPTSPEDLMEIEFFFDKWNLPHCI